MTRVLTIAGVNMTGIVDLTGIKVGGQADMGSSSISEIVVYDDPNTIWGAGPNDTLIRKQWSLTEDASNPLVPVYLARGRIADFETFRLDPDGVKVGYRFVLEDQNLELRGFDVHGWVRPEETGWARVQALATAYLNGSPRASTVLDFTTYVPNTNTFLMPAKTYDNSDVVDVLAECAAAEVKNFFVTVDHKLFYDLQSSAAYAATLEISDGVGGAAAPDSDTYFAPVWDQGPALRWRGQDFASGIRMQYGTDQSVLVTDAQAAIDHDLYIVHLFDSSSTSAAEATNFANGELDYRQIGARTYLPTLHLRADQTDQIAVGHSVWIQVKAAVDSAALGRVRRRVAQIQWEPDGATWYWARLNLDQPIKQRRPFTRGKPPTGPKPPTPGSGNAPVVGTMVLKGDGDGAGLQGSSANTFTITSVTVGSGSDRALYVLTLSSNTPSAVTWDPGSAEALTKIGQIDTVRSDGATQRMTAWRLLNPTSGTGTVSVNQGSGSNGSALVIPMEDVNQTTPNDPVVTAEGLGMTTELSIVTGDFQTALNLGGWMNQSSSGLGNPTPGGSQTDTRQGYFDATAQQADLEIGGGYSSAVPTWTFGAVRKWSAIGIAVNGNGTVGDSPAPVGPPGSADFGDCTDGFATVCHIHDHGLNSTDEEHQHNATDSEFDPTGTPLTATNVQEAITQVAAGMGSTAPFDHGVMGTTETVAIADGTWHRGTLDANVAITVEGFTVDEGQIVLFGVAQDATGGRSITWDPDVVFADDDQPAQGANEVTWYLLWSDEGDSVVYGAKVGGGVTDHGALTGLADDDHTQYTRKATLTTTGDIYYASGASTPARLAVGAADTVLTVAGGVPTWAAAASGAQHILLADGRATPFAFTDLLQMDDGSDFMWSDPE